MTLPIAINSILLLLLFWMVYRSDIFGVKAKKSKSFEEKLNYAALKVGKK